MKRRGFSLIELLLVMVLVGLSIGLILPSWISYQEWRCLRSTAWQLVSVLREEQAAAVASRFSRSLFFLPKTGMTPAHYYAAEQQVDGSWVARPELFLSHSLDFREALEIRFSPSGAPSPTGTVRLFSGHAGDKKISVSIGTGRVYLK